MQTRTTTPDGHTVDLTSIQRSALNSLSWGAFYFGGLLTGEQTPRRVVLALCRKGLARSQGLVEQCDGDGFIQHGRVMREAFAPTPLGVEVGAMLGGYYAEQLLAKADGGSNA